MTEEQYSRKRAIETVDIREERDRLITQNERLRSENGRLHDRSVALESIIGLLEAKEITSDIANRKLQVENESLHRMINKMSAYIKNLEDKGREIVSQDRILWPDLLSDQQQGSKEVDDIYAGRRWDESAEKYMDRTGHRK